MTLTDHRSRQLVEAPATTRDHPFIADFLATTDGSGAASSPPIPGTSPNNSTACSRRCDVVLATRQGGPRLRGCCTAARWNPRLGGLRLRPERPPDVVDSSSQRLSHGSTPNPPNPGGVIYGCFIGTDQQPAIDALIRGARTRRPIHPDPQTARGRESRRPGGRCDRRPHILSGRRSSNATWANRCASCSSTPSSSISATCRRRRRSGISTLKAGPSPQISASPRSTRQARWSAMCSDPPTPPVSGRPRSAAPTPTTSGCARPAQAGYRGVPAAQDLAGRAASWPHGGVAGHRHQQPQQCAPAVPDGWATWPSRTSSPTGSTHRQVAK